MKVLHLGQSDLGGGAALSAFRTHRALVDAGHDSHMKVRQKLSDDWRVAGPHGPLAAMIDAARPLVGNLLLRSIARGEARSGNLLPSNWSRAINASQADVVHLHWVGGETASLEDMGRITRPLVWTLHDMWAFCATEHYAGEGMTATWRSGYDASSAWLDRWVFRSKLRGVQRHRAIAIAPSHWIERCARASLVMKDWRIRIIPNIVNTHRFQPLDRGFCRHAMGLPVDRDIVLFGAIRGANDPRKGWDLLAAALHRLHAQSPDRPLLCVVFGQSEPAAPPQLPFPVRWTGHVHDEITLSLLYNAADVVVVPSRQEVLPQSATEAQACGRPVVAFDCTGLPDAVLHQLTGFLAKAFDAHELAIGIDWVLQDKPRAATLGASARQRALSSWAPGAVLPQLLAVYREAAEWRPSTERGRAG